MLMHFGTHPRPKRIMDIIVKNICGWRHSAGYIIEGQKYEDTSNVDNPR